MGKVINIFSKKEMSPANEEPEYLMEEVINERGEVSLNLDLDEVTEEIHAAARMRRKEEEYAKYVEKLRADRKRRNTSVGANYRLPVK